MAIRVPFSSSSPTEMPQELRCTYWPQDPRQLVVKVHYEGSLRRFSSFMDEHSLDLDMNRLRAIIVSLFNLGSGANLVLSYLDSDCDMITFSSDVELMDATFNQRLNPLRIYAAVNKSAPSTIEASSFQNPKDNYPLQQVPVPYPFQDPACGRPLSASSDCSSGGFTAHDTVAATMDPKPSSLMTRSPLLNVNAGYGEANRMYKLPMPCKLDINSKQPLKAHAWSATPMVSLAVSPDVSNNFKVDEETELALLDELREVGFLDQHLNLEMLRKNGHDLDKTICCLYRSRTTVRDGNCSVKKPRDGVQ